MPSALAAFRVPRGPFIPTPAPDPSIRFPHAIDSRSAVWPSTPIDFPTPQGFNTPKTLNRSFSCGTAADSTPFPTKPL